jgi:hypothetical protein
MRTVPLFLLVLCPFLITSCSPSVTADSRAADAAAIQALDGQWSATAAKNDLAGTLAFYADDAVLLPPNAPIATDAKSIRESWGACSLRTRPYPGTFPRPKSRNPANSDISMEHTRC